MRSLLNNMKLNNMKKFILKTSIIFLFSLLFFRLTVISLVNEYENKINKLTSSAYLIELKKEIIKDISNSNKKENILYPEDAQLLSIFIRKILTELKIN
jgi:hypothetical protein